MAIALNDTTTYVFTDGGAGSLTHSHTVAGSDTFMLIGFCMGTDQGWGTVAYNSVSLGSAIATIGNSTNQVFIEVYALVAPADGTHDVTATRTGSNDGRLVMITRSYTGVDQTTPYGTPATAYASEANPTVDVSSAVDELVSDFMAMFGGGSVPAVGGGQTERVNSINDIGDGFGGSSDEAGGTTVTMSWSGGKGLIAPLLGCRSSPRPQRAPISTSSTARPVGPTSASCRLLGPRPVPARLAPAGRWTRWGPATTR